MTNINPYLFHYNTDINGNLQTVKIDNEKSQASPLHFAIQMSQIPKKGQGIVVLNDKNEELYEVNKRNKISSNSYWVDYNNGIIYLDSINAGKVFTYSFHGIGWEFISCSRIVDFKNVNGQTIRETLQEIIDRGRECIDALNTIGNAIELLRRIENYIIEATKLDKALKEDVRVGNQLHIDLTSKIATGTALDTSLGNKITTGTKLDTDLGAKITNGDTLKNDLTTKIAEGNTTKENLDQSRLEAQDDIATIKATGNGTWTIPSSAWTGTAPNLVCTINHRMSSKNLIVAVVDTTTQKSIMADYRIIDMDNIEMQSMEASSITVTINAKYYSGKDANIIAQEVIDARKGEATLDDRINNIELENETHVNCRKFGAKLDGVTDDTKAIQDMINYCESTRKIGIVNGVKTVVTGLKVGSFANIDFCNTIVYLKFRSDMPILMNKNIVFESNNIIDNNIIIKGGIWDCNGEGQLNTDKDGVVMCGVRFTGVRYLEFEPIEVYDTRRYAIYFVNVDTFKANTFNINHKLDDYALNKDGFHIGGKCTNFRVNSLQVLNNGDDGLPLNATDVEHGGQYTKANIDGDISNIYINNVYINGRQGIRLLSGTKQINGVYINNFKGVISDNVLLCEDFGLLYTGSMKNIKIGSIDVDYVERRHNYEGKFIRICNIGLNSDLYISSIKRNQIGVINKTVTTLEIEGIVGDINIGSITEIDSQSTHVINVINGGDGVNNLVINKMLVKSPIANRAILNVGGTKTFNTINISNVDTTSVLNFANISSKDLTSLILSNSVLPNTDYLISLSACLIRNLIINGVIKSTNDWIYNDTQSSIQHKLINGVLS